MIEVEVKARVSDKAAVLAKVAAFARSEGAVDKLDEYWHGPGWRENRGTRGFRLRAEGGETVVTRKSKSREGGIERNREIEFGVSDRDAFVELIENLGCEPYYTKRKRGEAFTVPADSAMPGGVATIEIFEVLGLGDFIEVELLVPEGDAEASVRAASRVRALLALSGVPESEIEPRFYSELLVEAGLIGAPSAPASAPRE
jgi:predicted adenylyl cyclase CyaB